MRRVTTVLLSATLLAAASCTSSTSGPADAPGGPGPSPSVSQSAGTSSAVGLRGVPIPSLACPTAPPTAAPEPPERVSGERQAYWICPAPGSDASPPAVDAVIISKADAAKYDALSQALALPDQVSASATPCPTEATLPVMILVETLNGPWLVHLPVDGCGNYPEALTSALALS